MSTHQPQTPLPHAQQEHVQQEEGSIVALILMLVAYLLAVVALVAVISGLTGWKIAIKGAVIPAGWGSGLAFLIIAGIFWGIAWIIDNPTIRKALGGWFWLVLLAGLGTVGYSVVYAINIWDAGGFMMYAVAKGDVKTVESYLKKEKLSAEQKVEMLRTSVYKRHAGVVRLLLEHGADANTPERVYRNIPSQGYLLFHRACSQGKLELIKPFVEKKVAINAMSKEGKTPLDMMLFHYYAGSAQIRPAVEYMLQHGAKLNLKKITSSQRRFIERDFPGLSDRLLQEDKPVPVVPRVAPIPVRTDDTHKDDTPTPTERRIPSPRTDDED